MLFSTLFGEYVCIYILFLFLALFANVNMHLWAYFLFSLCYRCSNASRHDNCLFVSFCILFYSIVLVVDWAKRLISHLCINFLRFFSSFSSSWIYIWCTWSGMDVWDAAWFLLVYLEIFGGNSNLFISLTRSNMENWN